MKKIFYFLASAIVALGAMACQNEVDESINPNTQSDVVSFTVAFDEATRIAMTTEGKTAKFAFEAGDKLYVQPRAILENDEEFEGNTYEFTTEDGETFSCQSAELVSELAQSGNYANVDNSADGSIRSNEGVDGFNFATYADLTAETVTLPMSHAVFHFTVPEGTTATLKHTEDIFDTEAVVGWEKEMTFTEGEHWVAAWTFSGTLSYSINGVVVKSIEKDFEAGKIYNLGTLGYEFTTITTKDQLFAFAAHVNAGNSYEGKTVKLGNDIDLEGAAWTPIGNLDVIKYANVNSTFLGTFDGQGNTISDFTIAQTGEAVGFFGAKFAGDIKNVKFDDVTVTGTHYGAVVVGWTDGAQRNADGQWNITGCEVTNSTVTLAPDSTPDNGDKAGAIVGYAYAINVTDNTVSNTTIQAYRDLGAIAGMAQENSKEATTVSGNTVGENVKVVIDNTVNYKNYTTAAQYNAGNYVGRISTNSVVENNTGEATIVMPKTAVDKLNEQIAAGESNITISESFEMTATDPRINIAEGQNVNITLAEGVVITGTFAESGSDALFNIAKGGELTICGEGKIALTAVKGNVSNYGQYIFENCGGVLNITGGTYNVEVTGSGSATWFIPTLINNNSTSGETVTNISGGYFYSGTCINIMRQFINHKTATATFNITGGEFEGTGTKTYGIWNQNSGGSGLGYINISGNAQMNNVYVENDAPKANAVVWGGTFGYEPGTAASSYNAVTIKKGYKAVENSGVWTVRTWNPVASVEGVEYEVLADALTAAGTTNVVTLLADANVATACVINANGHNLTAGDGYLALKNYKTENMYDVVAVTQSANWHMVGDHIANSWQVETKNTPMYEINGTNWLVVGNIKLEANKSFKLINGTTWDNAAGSPSSDTTADDIDTWFHAGTGNIKVANEGTYNIYYDTKNQVVIVANIESAIPELTFKTYYLNTGGTGLWNQAGAWFGAHLWTGSAARDYKMVASGEANIFKIEVPIGFSNAIFLRMGKDATDFSNMWNSGDNGYWNKTGDLTINTNNCYTITSWSSGKWSVK